MSETTCEHGHPSLMCPPCSTQVIKPAVRELLCQRCGNDYPVWHCPNELWNQVQQEGEHFFCPTCFTVLAEQRGVIPTAWLLTRETDNDRKLQSELARLRREVEILEACVRKYGDEENWWTAKHSITDKSRQELNVLFSAGVHTNQHGYELAQSAINSVEAGRGEK